MTIQDQVDDIMNRIHDASDNYMDGYSPSATEFEVATLLRQIESLCGELKRVKNTVAMLLDNVGQ